MKKTILLMVMVAMAFIVRAEQPPVAAPQSIPPHIEFKNYGFYALIDYECMINFSHFSGQYYEPVTGTVVGYTDKYVLNGVSAVAGWQWCKESAVGLGFSYLNDPAGSFSQIPVFVEYRSHFLRSRLTPFTAVQLGYSIPFGTKNNVSEYTRIDEGGITFGFSCGLRLAISQKVGLNMFAGYQMIHCNSVERGFNSVAATRLSELYHNIKFGTGISF